VNLKHGGILIIGNIARAYAIRAGLTAKRTVDRLRGREQAGEIDAETREGLEEAFRFLGRCGSHHHVDQLRAGQEPRRLRRPEDLGGARASGAEGGVPGSSRTRRKCLALRTGVAMR
jgi:CBS domain-containing protein